MASKIICIAEAYDSMVRGSEYRIPLTPQEAVRELKDNAGTQSDEFIVQTSVEKVLGLPKEQGR